MTNACRQLRERRKVLDIFAFNKAVNQMLSLCSFFFSAGGNAQCVLCCGVRGVGLYPDNGYDPDADDFYEERVLDGSVVYGDREIGLREKQVVAEQNMLIKKLTCMGNGLFAEKLREFLVLGNFCRECDVIAQFGGGKSECTWFERLEAFFSLGTRKGSRNYPLGNFRQQKTAAGIS